MWNEVKEHIKAWQEKKDIRSVIYVFYIGPICFDNLVVCHF